MVDPHSKVKPADDEPKHIKVEGLHTNNEFGPLQVDTKKEAELCVPSTKEVLGDAVRDWKEKDDKDD